MSGDQNQIKHRIVEVVSGVFRLPTDVVERGVSPDSIDNWNSEKHVELVVALEERFGCMFDAEEVPELTSLEQMEDIITRHGQGSDA